jgi:pimeloyl-ACP methyl ester carboxylesterase
LKWSIIKSFWSKFTWNFWKRSHRPTFDEAVYSVLYKLKKKNQKEIFDKYVYESGKVLFEIGFWFLDFNRATKVDESQIRCPVLVVSGAEDRITPPPVVKKIAKKYKTVATYKSFSNHGHWVLGEPGWEKIAEYVADWLAAIQ